MVGIADTAELPAHCVRRPFTSPSCDRKALTKLLPQFWFSDSLQDCYKTALLQFVNKISMTKIGLVQVLSARNQDELVDAYFTVGAKCKCPMCDKLNIL